MRARDTMSDGKVIRRLYVAEEGGYVVTSPLDPELNTQAETLKRSLPTAGMRVFPQIDADEVSAPAFGVQDSAVRIHQCRAGSWNDSTSRVHASETARPRATLSTTRIS